MPPSNNRNETFEQWRQRMLDDTARFIEWGLKHPEKVDWIPMQPLSKGGANRFSEKLRSSFWTLLSKNPGPPE